MIRNYKERINGIKTTLSRYIQKVGEPDGCGYAFYCSEVSTPKLGTKTQEQLPELAPEHEAIY